MKASLDKSSSTNVPNPRSSKVLNNLSRDTCFIEKWLQLNPKVRDYTLYSHPLNCAHFTYSFIPKQFVHAVQSRQIESTVLSDHAPVHLQIDPTFSIPRTSNWRLNTPLLNSDPFCYFFMDSLSQFWLNIRVFRLTPQCLQLWYGMQLKPRYVILFLTLPTSRELEIAIGKILKKKLLG